MKSLSLDLDRRKFRLFDWGSFYIILALSVLGLLFVFSATYKPDEPISGFFTKQLFGVVTGLAIYWLMFSLNYKTMQQWGTVLYAATLGLLVFTLLKGSVGMGAQRWINLGFIKFQPSELAKLFFPAFFASTLAPEETDEFHLPAFLPILAVLGVSFLLILKQPDLGTALIVLFGGIVLLWLAHIGRAFFIGALVLAALAAPIGWSHLKPYQKNRVIVFLGGGASRQERYQIEQSRIAIGSGGMLGKGFLQGTQIHFNFLPESRTDFIFSVICEEMGFMGAALVIILFCLLFLRALLQIAQIHLLGPQLLAVGLIAPVLLSAVINIGMVLGLLPIVGIPLPFISYGITNLWIAYACMGWAANIIARTAIIS